MFLFAFQYTKQMEKAMAPHSSTLAWKIPWMEEPGGLQYGVAKSRTRLSNFTFAFHFHALEKEMATHCSVLPGESQGLGSLVGSRLWGRTESDTTERLSSSRSIQSRYQAGNYFKITICPLIEMTEDFLQQTYTHNKPLYITNSQQFISKYSN